VLGSILSVIVYVSRNLAQSLSLGSETFVTDSANCTKEKSLQVPRKSFSLTTELFAVICRQVMLVAHSE